MFFVFPQADLTEIWELSIFHEVEIGEDGGRLDGLVFTLDLTLDFSDVIQI